MKLHKAVCALLVFVLLLAAVFFAGRFGWKAGGFRFCESAGIECVAVAEDSVRIAGCCPGLSPEGFCGYYAEEREGTLYVGFRFSALFGFFEPGDFDITIPTTGTVDQVILKTGKGENIIWPAEDATA